MQLPQDVVAIFAGVLAHLVKARHGHPAPSIGIWEWSPESMDLRRREIPAHRVVVIEQEGWSVRISSGVLDAIRAHRQVRLPGETGGVLLGELDHGRRTIYVAHALTSPVDSIERPTAYIRGVAGLRERVAAIAEGSGGHLGYVGEWHTHPDSHDASPSETDRRALRLLADELSMVGLPALIVILGPGEDPGILVSEAA